MRKKSSFKRGATMNPYFLGIDIGTSSVKAVVVDEEGTVVASAQRQYDISKPQLKYAEQDIEALHA